MGQRRQLFLHVDQFRLKLAKRVRGRRVGRRVNFQVGYGFDAVGRLRKIVGQRRPMLLTSWGNASLSMRVDERR
eukprot:11213296-Lingulodinium_polyedra.AAC.1